MAKLTRIHYSLILLILTVVLAGCELSRDSNELQDASPMSDLPPTLAPLGVESDLVVEATPIPTVINVQATATETTLSAGAAADDPNEPVAPTSQVVEVGDPPVVTGDDVEGASVAPESFVPPAEQGAAQEAIVVDAPSDDLPIGGPVAANPPTSDTIGDYDGAVYGEATYTVQAGDTLFAIAQHYGTTVEAIVYANGLTSDFIYVGQILDIPADDGSYTAPSYEQPSYQQPAAPGVGGNTHVIAQGETLYRIALQYGVSVDAIAGTNGIPYPYIIQAGQSLAIPGPGAYTGPPPPAPADGYYQQPNQAYPPQPAPPTDNYYPPQDNYYPNPQDNYYPNPQDNTYYPTPQDDNYYPAPGNAGTHTVMPGETLYSISLRYGTTAEALASANGLFNPNQIYVGQVLYLP